MKIAYKLIGSEMKTHKGFQWELGKWYETTGEGGLCSPGWLHFYNDPLVGMFMNPIHANIKNPRLFRAEVKGKFLDDHGLKCGYTKARLVEELTVPQISPVQRVRFAIFCVKEVYKEKKWNKWADNWLSGKDRTTNAAWSTKCNFCTSRTTSAASATESAFYATRLALSAEESAFYITRSAASAAESAFYAVRSATIAFYATKSADSAAQSATKSATKSKKIDLIRIARKAMEN